MRTLIYALTLLTLVGCPGKEKPNSSNATPAVTASSTTPVTDQSFPMTARIVSRDAAENMVNLDNKEVPGKMMAMKMDYKLRGAEVGSLPPDGTTVEVTVHDHDGSYYITDVKPAEVN